MSETEKTRGPINPGLFADADHRGWKLATGDTRLIDCLGAAPVVEL